MKPVCVVVVCCVLCVCVMYMLYVWWWFVASNICLAPTLRPSFPLPLLSLSLSSASPPPPRYLTKGWLQTGRKDARLWRMYNAAVDGMVRWLLHHNPAAKLLYLANLQWQGGQEGVRKGRQRKQEITYLKARGWDVCVMWKCAHYFFADVFILKLVFNPYNS